MIDPALVYGPTADLAARALLQSQAYVVSSELHPDHFFTWKSGVRAPVYTDCRVIQSHPGPFQTLVQALARSIEHNFPGHDSVVGMAEAGVVWSAPVAMGLGVPHGFVRKARKAHGRGRMVEGAFTPSNRVVLVDDLMAGGGTAGEAIRLIEEETGAQVIGVQTIVNWDFHEMRKRFREINVRYRALVSFPQILDVAVSVGLLSESAATELKAFYINPREHEWELDAFEQINEPFLTKEAI
jgi:orotate phosphoribosyltransferase